VRRSLCGAEAPASGASRLCGAPRPKYVRAFTRGNALPRNAQTRFSWQGATGVFSLLCEKPAKGEGHSSPGSRRGVFWLISVNDVLAELNLHLVPQQLELRELLPENETVATVSGTLVMMELKGMVRLVGPMTYARERSRALTWRAR
jgi:hypothetical protein